MPDLVVKLTPGEETRLSKEIGEQIERHESETAGVMEQIRLWHRFYELDTPPKTFPHRDASNINFPIITIAVDSFKSKLKQTVRGEGSDLWLARAIRHGQADPAQQTFPGASVEGRPATWGDVASAVTDFCNALSDDDIAGLKLNDVLDDWIDCLAKEGTAPVKVMMRDFPIVRRVQNTRTKKWEQEIVSRPAPSIIPLSITECVWTTGIADLEDMWLFGHRLHLLEGQFRNMAKQMNYRKEDFEASLTAAEQYTDPVEAERNKMEGITPQPRAIHRVYVLSVDWIRDDGNLVPLVVSWHRGSRRLLRIIAAPVWMIGMKGYEVARFERRGRRFLGRSPVANLVPINRACNTALNQAFDANSYANVGAVKAKAGSKAAAELEANGIYSGMVMLYDTDPDEIQVVNLGQPHTFDTIALINLLLQFAERVSRVTDAVVGQIQSAKRVGASTGMTIIQEGATLLDEVIGRFRVNAGNAMIQVLYFYNQERPSIFTDVLGPERGALVQRALGETEYPLSAYLRVTLKATSSTRSKDLDRARLIAASQVLTGYFTQLTNMITPLLSPQVPQAFKDALFKVLTPQQEIMRRLAEASKLDDPESIMPDLIGQLRELSQNAAVTMQNQPGAGQPGIPPPAPGIPTPQQAAATGVI